MNEVMCLAEDIGIKIFYQDTDSMHIESDKVQLLAVKFQETYNKELIGKKLGQFHSDFDFKSDELPYAIKSIFMGKKAYIDLVRCIRNGIEFFELHCRLKSIPGDVLNNTAKEKYKNDPMANWKLFEYMYDNKFIFDMLNTHRPTFKAHANYNISTVRNNEAKNILTRSVNYA